MKVKIQKWGNSASIRLSPYLLTQLNVKIGDSISVESSPGKLTLSTPKLRYKLEDLLAQMPDGFPKIEEWENMPSIGREKL